MSFLEGVGAALGIGATGIRVHLDTPADTAPAGKPVFGALETITGEVVLSGGNVEQSGRLDIVAIEWWIVSTGKSTTRHELKFSETVIASHLSVEADATDQSFPFALTLPDRPLVPGHDWEIRACFHVDGVAASRTVVSPIVLIPSAPVRGLIACLKEIAPFHLTQQGVYGIPSLGHTFYDFAPPHSLHDAMDGVKIVVEEVTLPPAGDVIRGELDINPQERRFADYLKGGRPHEHRSFRFPATVLAACAPGGGGRADTSPSAPPNQIVVAALRDLLYPFLSGGQQGL